MAHDRSDYASEMISPQSQEHVHGGKERGCLLYSLYNSIDKVPSLRLRNEMHAIAPLPSIHRILRIEVSSILALQFFHVLGDQLALDECRYRGVS